MSFLKYKEALREVRCCKVLTLIYHLLTTTAMERYLRNTDMVKDMFEIPLSKPKLSPFSDRHLTGYILLYYNCWTSKLSTVGSVLQRVAAACFGFRYSLFSPLQLEIAGNGSGTFDINNQCSAAREMPQHLYQIIYNSHRRPKPET